MVKGSSIIETPYTAVTHTDLLRWQARLGELRDKIAALIALLEDRHNRNIHLPELEAVAIKAVRDGYV